MKESKTEHTREKVDLLQKYLPSSEQMIPSGLRTEREKDGDREGQGSRLRFLPADAPPDEHLWTLRTHGCN